MLRNILSIFGKEWKIFFHTFMAPLVLGGTAFLNALFVLISNFNERATHEEATIVTFLSFMLTIILAMGILSMGSIVEEKNKGTMEFLYTAPLTDLEIVAGKFLFGLVVCFIVSFGINAFFPILLYSFWKAPLYIVVSGSIGVFLLGSFTYSVGMFGSSLGKNQMIAFLITAIIILNLWVIGFFSHLFEAKTRAILFHFHIFSHFIGFSKGVIPLSGVVFFLSGTFTFLFLTTKSLESRRWLG
jgi:ABC-2 type transport system permease protein